MNACSCGTICAMGREDLVCEKYGVPYELARHPIEMSQTLMSAHNRIRMMCGLCVRELRRR